MKGMLARGVRAALLRRWVYADVQSDPDAILHALGIVVLVGIASALATEDVLGQGAQDPFEPGRLTDRLIGLWMSIVTSLLSWVLWAMVAYVLGSKFLRGQATYQQLLRSLGITYAPGVLLAAGSMPVFGGPVATVGTIWVFVAAVVAVRETQGSDWIGAALSTFLGWFMLFVLLRAVVLGPYGSGM